MKLFALSLDEIVPSTGDKGATKLLIIHADMTKSMLHENICNMLGHLSQDEAYNLLSTEFPELFDQPIIGE